MIVHVPRGGAIGEWLGGEHALSVEAQSLWAIEHLTVAVASDKPKKVKPRPMPEGIRDMERERERAFSKAKAYQRKHGRKK